MVIWLIGISGAGKTTLGTKIKQYYDGNNINSFILDGDLIRDFHDNDLGYSREDRIENIKRIMLAAYILEQNAIVAIVCNISPFEHLREVARKKLDNYIEIFLDKDINVAKNNVVKNVYKNNMGKTSLIGIDIKFEKPLNSDLIIEVDKESEAVSFEKIINYLKSR